VPNQEKGAKCAALVTYHDNSKYMRVILLPKWELKQAYSCVFALNSLCLLCKARMGLVRGSKRDFCQYWCLTIPVANYLFANNFINVFYRHPGC